MEIVLISKVITTGKRKSNRVLRKRYVCPFTPLQ
jgi:hypothetical protein